MLSSDHGVQSATIVDRRSGPGYRIVLCRRTRSGTPVLETLPDSFDTVERAEQHAIAQLGVAPAQLRVKARTARTGFA